MHLHTLTTSAALLLHAAAATAACTRDGLKAATDRFFAQAMANNAKTHTGPPAPFDRLAAGAKITQNNQLLAGLAASAYGNMTAFVTAFRVQAVDEQACTIATMAIAYERNATAPGGASGAIVSLRLRADPTGAAVTEVELLNALAGSHALFRPLDFPAAAPALWGAPLARPATRAELLRVVDSYPTGMAAGDSSQVLAAADCPRWENGYKTTDSCGKNMDLFKWPVTDRRYVVDATTGVAMASFFFHYKLGKGKMMEQGIRPANGTTGLWLHEYFKIEDGKIVNVQAAMQTLPAEYKDVWGSKV